MEKILKQVHKKLGNKAYLNFCLILFLVLNISSHTSAIYSYIHNLISEISLLYFHKIFSLKIKASTKAFIKINKNVEGSQKVVAQTSPKFDFIIFYTKIDWIYLGKE